MIQVRRIQVNIFRNPFPRDVHSLKMEDYIGEKHDVIGYVINLIMLVMSMN